MTADHSHERFTSVHFPEIACRRVGEEEIPQTLILHEKGFRLSLLPLCHIYVDSCVMTPDGYSRPNANILVAYFILRGPISPFLTSFKPPHHDLTFAVFVWCMIATSPLFPSAPTYPKKKGVGTREARLGERMIELTVLIIGDATRAPWVIGSNPLHYFPSYI